LAFGRGPKPVVAVKEIEEEEKSSIVGTKTIYIVPLDNDDEDI
jgi:hypothetical protein